MYRSRVTALSIISLIVIGLAGCAGASTPTPGWTYSPTSAPPTAPTATLAPTATAAPSPASGTDAVALSEWKVDVASTLKAGTTTFNISNNGAIEHELLVFKSDLAPSAYPTDAAGDIKEDGAGITLLSDGDNIAVGGAQARTIDLAPGTYLFVCNIPGHFKAGMFLVVTVTP
jgi:uncharacterized cupredoxin-like copper-binding protein